MSWLEKTAAIDRLPEEGLRDLHGDSGIACYTGYRHSLCHGWASGPVPFLAEEVLGIRILEPGCRRVALCPRLGSLEWAEGSYPTPLGLLTVNHRRLEDGSTQTRFDGAAGAGKSSCRRINRRPSDRQRLKRGKPFRWNPAGIFSRRPVGFW